MSYSVSEETFDSLDSYWRDSSLNLNWSSVFVLPPWLRVWWQTFGTGDELYLRSLRQGKELLGLAPLRIKGGTAYLVGSADVCDYLDFITVPGKEASFCDALISELDRGGIKQLNLESLRPETTALRHLADIARNRGYRVSSQPENVALEMALPPTWEEYLALLSRKQRHETKRKLRRLEEAGQTIYHCRESSQPVTTAMDTFLRLFRLSRKEKASFMTEDKETFFRRLAEETAKNGLLQFGTLEFDGTPVAMIMGFDYKDAFYLYNSGYDPRYKRFSIGLLSKLLCIRESINRGKKIWDFLKGGETYKYHLGGREVSIYHCQITKS
jgi:CelD/BcsL family acetyltransferase involved in cellulose biosynthesis